VGFAGRISLVPHRLRSGLRLLDSDSYCRGPALGVVRPLFGPVSPYFCPVGTLFCPVYPRLGSQPGILRRDHPCFGLGEHQP
jgi:hypothetical protein